MKLDFLPSLEISLNRFTRESMNGKNEAPLLENVDQIDDGGSDPLAILVVRCRRGHNYSTQYQDRKFLEMRTIIRAFEYRTSKYAELVTAEEEAERREQERRDAEAKKTLLRNEKRSVLMALRELERRHVAAANAAKTDPYDPAGTNEALDSLDLVELQQRFEGLTKKL